MLAWRAPLAHGLGTIAWFTAVSVSLTLAACAAGSSSPRDEIALLAPAPEASRAPDAVEASAAPAGASQVVLDCTSGGGAAATTPDVRGRVRGVDAEFEDRCDAAGNLVEYRCEVAQSNCSPVGCDEHPTGAIVSERLDCGGSCVAGACAIRRCPDSGDALRYDEVDPSGDARVTDLVDEQHYACTLAPESARGAVDCAAVKPGTRAVIDARGRTSAQCLGGSVGNLALCVEGTDCGAGRCTYRCAPLR